MWKKLNRQLDLGTVYTMIAGLLNVLAIYDAYGGPVRLEPEEPPTARKKTTSPTRNPADSYRRRARMPGTI